MTRRTRPAATPPPAPTPPARPPRVREADLLAIGTFLLCMILGWATRNALNPDGVSYLDLARRVQEGDWGRFVQGYWSPLYPLLLAGVAVLTGAESVDLLGWVHLLNALIAGAGIWWVWRLARHRDDPRFTRAAFAILLLAAARTPRIDAVSPDLLLVAVFAALSYELLVHATARSVRLGALLGLAFLVKTSGWPWFLAAVVVLAGFAADGAARRRIAGAAAVAVGVMLLWLVPLSLKTGRPTLGTAGALNYCWYLRACDSRSPDTHRGSHRAFAPLVLSSTVHITQVRFADEPWTWQPWSDPSAWAAGVESQGRHPPTVAAQLRFWGLQTMAVFAFWWSHILLAVLLPLWWLAGRRPGRWRAFALSRSAAFGAVVLGLLGVGQFIAVHAEPRLIAPYVLLASLGLAWWLTEEPVAPGRSPRVILVATWLGLATALPRWAEHAWGHARTAAAMAERIDGIRASHARAHRDGMVGNDVVVVGEVFPLLADAWLLGVRIIAQVPPASAAVIAQRPLEEQTKLVLALPSAYRNSSAGAVWLSRGKGAFLVAPVQRTGE